MQPKVARIDAALALLALAALGGCVPLPKPKPAMRVSADDFRSRYPALCLDTPSLPEDMPDPEAKRKRIEQSLEASLTNDGFKVVGERKSHDVWLDVVSREGGFYDPLSGAPIEGRLKSVRLAAFAELHARLGCDAIVQSHVVVVAAPWIQGKAEWDGEDDSLMGGGGSFGRVPALSLWVSILDLQGDEIYFGTGGIQVLAMLQGNLFSQHFKQVDDSTLLPPDRISFAVHASLQRLVERPTPSAPTG